MEQPVWIRCIATIHDDISSWYPSDELRRVAVVFAEYAEQQQQQMQERLESHDYTVAVGDSSSIGGGGGGASSVPEVDADALLSILSDLGVDAREDELEQAVHACGCEGDRVINFNQFAYILQKVIENIHKSMQDPAPRVDASATVWQLLSTTVPMIVRDGPPQAASTMRFGAREEVDQDNRSANIEQLTGIDEFEARLKKLEEEKEKEEQATLAANAPSTLRRSPGKGKVKGGGMTKSGGWWSDEVALLEARHREQPKRAWARADVATAFKTLRLVDCDVTDCDPGLSQFVNVTKLDLSGNKVRRVGVLPPKLQGLTINSNNVSSLSGVGNGAGAPELRYLAMAYNGMPRIPRGLEARSFPLLSALDLSGNDLSDLDATILGLGELSSLTHLFLIRNPITLVAAYRKRMLFALPSLVQLDDMDVPEESQFQQPSGGEEPPPPPQVGSAVLLKATVEGVSGLPIEGSKFEELLSLPGGDGDEGGSGLVGRIQVGMLTAAAHSKELPWKASLVGKASGDGDDVSVKSGKGGGKKSKTPTPEPTGDLPTPEVIQLRMNASAELRTHVFFEGVQISVMLSRSGDGAGGDGEEKDSSEGKEEEKAGGEEAKESKEGEEEEKGGEGAEKKKKKKKSARVEVVGTAMVSLRAFLEPSFYSQGSCVIHERVPLKLEPAFAPASGGAMEGTEPGDDDAASAASISLPEVKVTFELNPEDMITALLLPKDGFTISHSRPVTATLPDSLAADGEEKA